MMEEYYNYPNRIVKNIFTDKEIQDIYQHIEATPEDRRTFVPVFSHTAFMSWMPNDIVKKIVDTASEAHGQQLVLRELSFARYGVVDPDIPVRLTPHRDETFSEPRVTFDIQIRSNRSWPIVVEGKSFTLSDNEALMFAGTHQVHWREPRSFSEDDVTDMIFAHFSSTNWENENLGLNQGDAYDLGTDPSEHHVRMQKQVNYWAEEYKKES